MSSLVVCYSEILTATEQLHKLKQVKKSTFLWSVETNRETRAYLFGTIHEPFTEIWQSGKHIVKPSLIQQKKPI